MITQENEIKYLSAILDLKRNIAGVKFIEFEDDYKALDIPEQKGTTCLLGRLGLDGKHFKADAAHITCSYGSATIGVTKAHQTIRAGQSYAGCGLYASKSIAYGVVEDMHFLNQIIYGVELGALEDVENADLVLIACDTLQAMRIFQGYAYYYGTPKNVSFVGNQAMCSDMLAKPFSNNDINLTLFCEGARKYGNYGSNEVGISMPLEIFHKVAKGVYLTVNPVANRKEKAEISTRLGEAGFQEEFDMEAAYGIILDYFDNKVVELGI